MFMTFSEQSVICRVESISNRVSKSILPKADRDLRSYNYYTLANLINYKYRFLQNLISIKCFRKYILYRFISVNVKECKCVKLAKLISEINKTDI